MRPRRPTHSDQNTNQAGSPPVGEPVFLVVGKLRRPHGVQGEMIMDVETDFPERIHPGSTLFVGETHQPEKVRSVRWHDQALLISFDDYDTPEAIGRYRNAMVYVTVKSLPKLPEGQYYFHELVNMTVVDGEGNLLGILSEVLETGANDVYVVTTPDGGELLLPVIENVILEVNIKDRIIRAQPPDWL